MKILWLCIHILQRCQECKKNITRHCVKVHYKCADVHMCIRVNWCYLYSHWKIVDFCLLTLLCAVFNLWEMYMCTYTSTKVVKINLNTISCSIFLDQILFSYKVSFAKIIISLKTNQNSWIPALLNRAVIDRTRRMLYSGLLEYGTVHVPGLEG